MVCERDCGSVLVREDSGRVVRRFKYPLVVGSLDAGAGLGDGVSK